MCPLHSFKCVTGNEGQLEFRIHSADKVTGDVPTGEVAVGTTEDMDPLELTDDAPTEEVTVGNTVDMDPPEFTDDAPTEEVTMGVTMGNTVDIDHAELTDKEVTAGTTADVGAPEIMQRPHRQVHCRHHRG